MEQIYQYFIKQSLRTNLQNVFSQLSPLGSPMLFLFVMTLNRVMLIFESKLRYAILHAGMIQNNKKISHQTKIHRLSAKLLASQTWRFHLQAVNYSQKKWFTTLIYLMPWSVPDRSHRTVRGFRPVNETILINIHVSLFLIKLKSLCLAKKVQSRANCGYISVYFRFED